jgi:hypothetical protein
MQKTPKGKDLINGENNPGKSITLDSYGVAVISEC